MLESENILTEENSIKGKSKEECFVFETVSSIKLTAGE